MKIVVCIKQVPATGADKRYTDDLRLDRTGVEAIINPLDEYAIEQALRLVDDGSVRERDLPVDGPRAGIGGASSRPRHGRRRRRARDRSGPGGSRRVGDRQGAGRGARQAGSRRRPDGHGIRRRAWLARAGRSGRHARAAAAELWLGAEGGRWRRPSAPPVRHRLRLDHRAAAGGGHRHRPGGGAALRQPEGDHGRQAQAARDAGRWPTSACRPTSCRAQP